MKLPVRYILVYGIEGATPFIIKLNVIPITDILQLSVSFHIFTSNLTQSVAQSFQANDTNDEYFKLLPTKHILGVTISLSDCELLNLHLQKNYINVNIDQRRPMHVICNWFQFTAYYHNIYSISNFISGFINNYIYFQTEYFKNIPQKEITRTEQITKPVIEIEEFNKHPTLKEEDIKEFELIHNDVDLDSLTLINDSLQYSPNNITKFYISKYLQIYINNVNYENEFEIKIDNCNLLITLNPLIDVNIIALSTSHYKTLHHILESFHIEKDEIINKMRSIVNEIIFIINVYLKDNNKKEIVIVPLKILELLMFIYACKYQQMIISIGLTKEHNDPISFHRFMLYWVNYYVQNILESINKSSLSYQTIYFNHPFYSILSNKIEFTDTLEQVLSKERYLLDVDKTSFINNVYKQLTSKENKPLQNVKLILEEPKVLHIKHFITDQVSENNWLSYSVIPTTNTRLQNHTILTKEYLQLLTLAISDDKNIVVTMLQKEMNPILLRNYEIILNHIFRELATAISEMNMISTLNLLTYYIRPFLSDSSTLDTEMFILYKCVIPYLYDIYKVDHFIDYFH